MFNPFLTPPNPSSRGQGQGCPITSRPGTMINSSLFMTPQNRRIQDSRFNTMINSSFVTPQNRGSRGYSSSSRPGTMISSSFMTPQNRGSRGYSSSSRPTMINTSFTTPHTRRGTLTSTRTSSAVEADGYTSRTIVAIAEGRGQARGEVGMACLDLHATHLIICQFSDTQTYTKVLAKLNIFQPVTILMCSTSCDVSGQPSRLNQQVHNEYPRTEIVALQRRLFNETKGLDRIKNSVAEPFKSVVITVTEKYYGLAASAALLKYVELVHNYVYGAKSLKIEFQGSDQTVMIDSVTARHLELIQNNHNPNSTQSLFGILNTCRTPGGCRLLRMNILQPPSNVEVITRRFDTVNALINSTENLYALMRVLGSLPRDLEHAIVSLIQIPRIENDRILEQRINHVILIKQALTLLPSFVQALEGIEDEYLQQVKESLSDQKFQAMLSNIETIINEEANLGKGAASMKIQRSFAVKPDVNPILDIARQAYIEIQEDMNKYVLDLGVEHNLSLRLLESATRGFYMQFILPGNVWELPTLPAYFLNIHKKRNIVSFTTETLLLTEQRIKEIIAEIQKISSLVVSELVAAMRGEIDCLYVVSEAVSYLDMLQALAGYSISTSDVRPTFSKICTAVEDGRHPILDSMCDHKAVPNNWMMGRDTNVMILTGPNMSGKTTFLKQAATLQIMAQIGCYVPASSATFRIVDSLFSRIGNGDSIECSASTFALEMTEMNYILNNVTNNSLIIIDELGRATSIEEGTATSWAMVEALTRTQASVLLATHYLDLTKLESLYKNVLNYRMEVIESRLAASEGRRRAVLLPDGSFSESQLRNDRTLKLHYSHVCKRGITDVEYYGIKLTKNSSYPPHVVKRATQLTKQITQSRKAVRRVETIEDIYTNSAEEEKAAEARVKEEQARYLLTSHMYVFASQFDLSDIDVQYEKRDMIRDYLKQLQSDFIDKFGAGGNLSTQSQDGTMGSSTGSQSQSQSQSGSQE